MGAEGIILVELSQSMALKAVPNSSVCDGSLNDMLLPFIHDFPIHDDEIIVPDQLLAAPILIHDSHNSMLPPKYLSRPGPPPQPQSIRTRRPQPLRKGTPSYRDNHIHSERKRRQDMTSLFDKLRAVLPNTQQEDFKVDRCTLVGHVIEYVRDLDRKVQDLAKLKADLLSLPAVAVAVAARRTGPLPGDQLLHPEKIHRPPAAAARLSSVPHVAPACAAMSSTMVSVRVYSPMDVFITLNCPKQRGLWPNLLALLQDTLHLHVLNIALSSTPLFCIHSIYAKIGGGSKNEQVCGDELQKILSDFVAAHIHVC